LSSTFLSELDSIEEQIEEFKKTWTKGMSLYDEIHLHVKDLKEKICALANSVFALIFSIPERSELRDTLDGYIGRSARQELIEAELTRRVTRCHSNMTSGNKCMNDVWSLIHDGLTFVGELVEEMAIDGTQPKLFKRRVKELQDHYNVLQKVLECYANALSQQPETQQSRLGSASSSRIARSFTGM